MGTYQRRTQHLEQFYARRTMTWVEARRMADTLLLACALHCPSATTGAIAKEFAEILAAYSGRREQP